MLSVILSVLGSLWGSAFGRLIIIGGGLFLFGLFKGWTWADAGKAGALKALNENWQLKITEVNRNAELDSQARIQAALDAAAAIVLAPADRRGLDRMCAADTDCRDRSAAKK